MVLIVNYDLYLRINGSWELHGRYASDQKKKAFLDAKNAEENQFYPVKIIKENFNSESGNSSENVIYMSKSTFDAKEEEEAQAKKEKEKRRKQIQKNKNSKKALNKKGKSKKPIANKEGSDKIITIGAKILILTTIAIILAKGLLWVISPILAIIYTGDDLSDAKFFSFLILFLSLAIPLIVKNISWNVLNVEEEEFTKAHRTEKRKKTISPNNLNDGYATPFEPVGIDYTKQVLMILNKYIAVLKELKLPINNFTKFGIKLALYGSCRYLQENKNLSQAQVNTLLYEAFNMFENNNVNSLGEFYEAKNSYENIDLAKTLIRSGESVMSNIDDYDKSEFDKLSNIVSSWYKLSEPENQTTKDSETSEEENTENAEKNKPSQLYEASGDLTEAVVDNSMEEDEGTKPIEIEEVKDAEKNEVVTVLFSDIVDSTLLNQEVGDAKALEILKVHNKIYRDCLIEHSGKEIKHTGDGIMASFTSVANAADAAIEMQKKYFEYNQENPTQKRLEVKLGMNTGEPIKSNNDLFGATVQIAARCCSQALGGEIIVTNVVKELLTGKNIKFDCIGEKQLKGINEPIKLYKILFTQDPIFEEERKSEKNDDQDLIKAGIF